jgi:hypothetical protein
MHELLFFAFVAWTSFCFAEVEIAIEGADGWAEKLPTWRLVPRRWISKLLFSGRPITGYHIWMELFIFSMMHLAYVYTPFSVALELQILAFFCFFSITEDFLWFVLNPAFGIRKFRAEFIWWHAKNWLWVAPRDYYVLLAVGSILYALSFYVS